jgi:tRNA(Ile)-lysidine synthase
MNSFIYFINRIDHILIERKLVLSKDKILIAVSGGRDSILLLTFLLQLRYKWEWQVGIVNCDHMWNDYSQTASLHLCQLASQSNLTYYQSLSPSYYKEEEKARHWRYKIFQRIAYLHGYNIIITAHTASDRIETFLYNLLKGSGIQGLQSLSWKREINRKRKKVKLIRPLLSTTRGELSELSKKVITPLWLDFSNLNLKICRNRIRYQLLPYLRFFFNPSLDTSIAQFAEILHGETLFLEALTKTLTKKIELTKENQKALDLKFLKILPLGIQRRIIKQFLDSQIVYSINFFHIEKVRIISNIFIYKSNIYLPKNYILVISQKSILVCFKIPF